MIRNLKREASVEKEMTQATKQNKEIQKERGRDRDIQREGGREEGGRKRKWVGD